MYTRTGGDVNSASLRFLDPDLTCVAFIESVCVAQSQGGFLCRRSRASAVLGL